MVAMKIWQRYNCTGYGVDFFIWNSMSTYLIHGCWLQKKMWFWIQKKNVVDNMGCKKKMCHVAAFC